jgi:hypothetical protein
VATVPLCTLDQFKLELKASSANSGAVVTFSAVDQNTALRNMAAVAARLAKLAGFEFVPRIDTLEIPVTSERVNTNLNTFTFPQPLLVLQGVVVGNTTLTVGTDVTVYPSISPYPYHALRLIWSSTHKNWYQYGVNLVGDPLVVQITGIWGYKQRYASEGWLAYEILQADINASVTTLTIADADGQDPFGFTPRFSIGQLIQIDSEWMSVSAVDTTLNTLTVKRAVQGSAAAAHLQNVVVSSWQTEDDIVRVVTRQACMFFARKGAFETASISDLAQVNYPRDLLAELEDTLAMYDYE